MGAVRDNSQNSCFQIWLDRSSRGPQCVCW